MSDRHCHHIHSNGVFCQSPPMRNRNYCYTHLQRIGRRMQTAQARSRAERCLLDLSLPEDLLGIQVALANLMDAVSDHRIEERRARLLLTMLRFAADNIKSKTPWDFRHAEADNSSAPRALDDPDFEQRYGLPQGLDLALSPDAAFPPPENAGSEPLDNPQNVGAPPLSPLFGDRVGTKSAPPTIPITVADIALWRHLHQATSVAAKPLQQGASQALAKQNPDDDSPLPNFAAAPSNSSPRVAPSQSRPLTSS